MQNKLQNNKLVSLYKYCAQLSDLGAFDDNQVLAITEVYKSHFEHWSISRVQEAFQAYAAGKLGEFDHYGVFGPRFFSKVLNKFKEYEARRNRIAPKTMQERLPGPKIDPAEERERAYLFIRECLENDEEIYIANWSDAYFYLVEKGHIKMTDQEKRDYGKKVKAELEQKVKSMKLGPGEIKKKLLAELHPDSVRLESRRKLVLEKINELIDVK